MARRFIPKGQDIGKVADYAIQEAEDFINNLPRKMLGCRTLRELFNEQLDLLSQGA